MIVGFPELQPRVLSAPDTPKTLRCTSNGLLSQAFSRIAQEQAEDDYYDDTDTDAYEELSESGSEYTSDAMAGACTASDPADESTSASYSSSQPIPIPNAAASSQHAWGAALHRLQQRRAAAQPVHLTRQVLQGRAHQQEQAPACRNMPTGCDTGGC